VAGDAVAKSEVAGTESRLFPVAAGLQFHITPRTGVEFPAVLAMAVSGGILRNQSEHLAIFSLAVSAFYDNIILISAAPSGLARAVVYLAA